MDLFFFFFNDTATTEIYTLSLHDALPILEKMRAQLLEAQLTEQLLLVGGREDAKQLRIVVEMILDGSFVAAGDEQEDRKSTRLNSSHVRISYAVFCLKKKKTCYITFSISY